MGSDKRASKNPAEGENGWPPIGEEAVQWELHDNGMSSRRARLATRGSYLAAVPSMIGSRPMPVVNPEVLALAEDAILQLTRFDTEVGGMVAPFTSILLRSESASSSEIERLTASPRAIALAELGRKAGPNARLVVANARAMEAAVELADDLRPASVIAMQKVLLHDTHPEFTGRWRVEQVWVGGSGNSPHGAEFVPPRFDRVPALMDDLINFARRDDLPIGPQVAIAHAQFETIHPFPDGNGRTGRALVQAMLRRLAVTDAVTVPVSAGLLGDTAGYFRALTAYRRGNVMPIIQAFSDASIASVVNGRELVADLDEFRKFSHGQATARRGSAAYRMIDLLIRQHVVDANFVAAELGVTPQNAQNAIESLVADGVLSRGNEGKRNRIYQATEISAILDRFAMRSRRPGRRQKVPAGGPR